MSKSSTLQPAPATCADKSTAGAAARTWFGMDWYLPLELANPLRMRGQQSLDESERYRRLCPLDGSQGLLAFVFIGGMSSALTLPKSG